MKEFLLASLMLIGALFSFLAAVGLVRMPDLFTRMQAATKSGTLGVGCIIAAVVIESGDLGLGATGFLVIAFQFLTAPVAAHMIARAAYFTGVQLWEGTVQDDLRGSYDPRTHVLRHHNGDAESEPDETADR